jgi:2-amino-4-hydroxy-6-hydroxymethyldihydropteridine diphosphokinase
VQHITYIALGSNLGDRLANLKAAQAAMEPVIKLIDCSSVYETAPWGFLEQPYFLNQVIRAETGLSAQNLLSHLKRIEKQLGREKTFRYGPRIIDLDIIFYDSEVIDSPPLVIPHPRIPERGFVLVPLAELAPKLRHPVLNQTIQELLAKVGSGGIRKYSGGGCK